MGAIFKVAIMLICAILITLGNINQDRNMVYCSTLIALISFLVQYIYNVKENIIIILFNLSIFIFLLGRYLVRMIQNIPMDTDPKYMIVALNLVFISLISVNITYLLLRPTKKRQLTNFEINHKKQSIDRIGLFSNTGLIISGVCALIINTSTYIYAQGNGYESLYLGSNLPVPSFIGLIADTMPFFIAIILSRLPNKKNSYLLLSSYLILQLPLLAAGKRTPFMVAVLIWISYVALRGYTDSKKEVWITKKEKTATLIIIPVLIVLIPFIGDIRGGNVSHENPLIKTLDSQGVTIDVISHGIAMKEETPKSIYGSYTIAPILSYVSTNFISRSLLNTTEIQVQTKESAELGLNYADTISYMVLSKDLYLSGQGLGSSYIIETYIDFGIAGLIVYSILMAILMRWMSNNFGRNQFKTFLIILLMMGIYILPRDASLNFIVSIIQIQTVVLFASVYMYDKFNKDKRNLANEK